MSKFNPINPDPFCPVQLTQLEHRGRRLNLHIAELQDPLTGEERKHLKKLNEQDKNKPSEVVNLLNRIIKKELKRKNLIAGTDTPPTPVTTGSSSEGTDADSTPKGPNIDRLVVTLCKSLEPVTTKGVKLDGAFDRQGMLLLKAYIDQMLAMPQESQDATA